MAQETTKDIQDLGMLIGTNFSEWREWTTALLRVQELAHYIDQTSESSKQSPAVATTKENLNMVTSYITMTVKPEIFQRVPQDERSNPALLMRCLEILCSQFRFMDLPPELRNMIYKHTVAGNERVTIQPNSEKITGYPAIVQVSSQIRSEALPVFYSTADFLISIGKTPEVAYAARTWILNVVRENLVYLRQVTVSLKLREPNSRSTKRVEIQFSTTRSGGLKVDSPTEWPQRLTKPSRALLEKHVGAVRETCKLLGVEDGNGRAIYIALIYDDLLWRYGCLTRDW